MAVFASLIRSMIDIVFPLECFRCGSEGAYCCIDCLATAVAETSLCVVGGVEIFSAYPYANPVVRRHLHDFKYYDMRSARSNIEKLLHRWALASGHLITEDSLLVPVPLHPKKQGVRGFNQAEVIAQMLGELLDLPVESGLLFRIRSGASQTKSKNRAKNVSGAFRARQGCKKNIFLVDDVMTSGETMRACAVALKNAGARCVGGFVLARGNYEKSKKSPPVGR